MNASWAVASHNASKAAKAVAVQGTDFIVKRCYMRVADVGRLDLAKQCDKKFAAGLWKATVKLVLAYASLMWNWAGVESPA